MALVTENNTIMASSLSPGASGRLKQLLEGLDAPGDAGNTPEAPPWLDRKLFDAGRKFYEKYLFCVFFSDLLSLILMLTMPRILRPLVYTGRSDTPRKALRRYVSTINHIIVWYTGDVWTADDPAHQDVMKVRSVHGAYAKLFNSSGNRARVGSAAVETQGCPVHRLVRRDLLQWRGAGVDMATEEVTYISQWDMAMTQYSFMGVMLTHPQRMGVWWVTQGELAGLLHFWRGMGWLLGVDDRYNFCSGTLEETQALCREVERLVMVPALAQAGGTHEVMASSLVDGMNRMVPGISYPALLRFLGDTLGVALPTLVARLTLLQALQYYTMRVVFHGLFLLLPWCVALFNGLLKLALTVIQGQHPRWHPKHAVTPYTYT